MPAPTFVAQYATAFDTATTPKTAMSAVAVNAGDVLVGIVVGESSATFPFALTEGGAASWSSAQSDGTDNFSSFLLQSYPCAAETLTVTATQSGANFFGANVIRFSGTDGAGASNKAQGASGNPSVSLTTTQANSAIVVLCTDWNAISGAQTFTNDFGGTQTDLTDFPGNAASYGVAIAYFPDAGAVGAKIIGMSSPAGQKWNIAAIEVKGTAGAPGQFLRPASDTTAGPWVASAGTLASCLDETTASEADYISTTANGTCRLALSSASTPDAGTRTFRFRTGGPAHKKLIARILESGTLVQARTIDPLPGALTDYAEVITGPITNYGAVQTEFEIADATTAPTVGPTFGAISAGANGGTTLSVPYPAGITANMLLVLTVTSGATNSETPATPSGFVSQGTNATTDGTYGIDTGPRRVTVFTRVAVGTETGNVSVSITNGDTCRGTITSISHAVAGYDWSIAATSGNDSTSGTGCSVTGGSIGWEPGDLLVISAAQRVDTATQSAQSITATGVTFGTRTNRASTAVTTGNDHRHIVDTVPTTAGTTSAAPTYAYTASAAASVAVHFLRIREVPPTEFGRVTFAEFEVPAASSGGATAPGATVSAVISIGAGAATGGASVAGQTLSAAAILLAGTASGGATAGGATIAVSPSLIAGTATGAGTAGGAVLAVNATVLPGTASGSSGATAPGATVSAVISIGAGAATGAASIAGQTLSAAAILLYGTASGGATAGGATLAVAPSLIAGTASGAGTAGGAVLAINATVLPGTASGTAGGTANGATLTVAATTIAGTAAGGATVAGIALSASAVLVPGTASGGATRAGATISVAATVVPGTASGGATQPGAVIGITASLLPGTAGGASGGTASGATIVTAVNIVPGSATGAAVGAGGTIVATAGIVAGVASGSAAGDLVSMPGFIAVASRHFKASNMQRSLTVSAPGRAFKVAA